MSDVAGTGQAKRTMRKILSRCVVGVLLAVVLSAFVLEIFLTTPFATAQMCRLLTSYLHQPVSLAGLDISGGSLHLKGVAVGNPPGFPAGNLVAVDSCVITPQWGELVLGRRSIGGVVFEGARLDLRTNGAGIWNYAHLQRVFAGGAPSAKGMLIRQLVVKKGAFRVNGQGVQGISLQIVNLDTQGAHDSRIELAFEDDMHTRYAVTGKARLGSDPALDLALKAPSISLKDLPGMLKMGNTRLIHEGLGDLQLNAGLHDGHLRVRSSLGFNRLLLSRTETALPLDGSVVISADYNQHADTLRLENIALTVDNLVKVHAAGTVEALRGERRFALAIGTAGIDLGRLSSLMPAEIRRRAAFDGMLDGTGIRVSGDGIRGVTGAAGTVSLRGGSITSGGRSLANGLAVTGVLAGLENGFGVKGRVHMDTPRGKPLLQAVDAPFEVIMSRRMKLVKAEISSLSAQIMGIGLKGRLGFGASENTPFSASLRIPVTALSNLNPFLDTFGLHLASGNAALSIEAAGRGLRDFTATATARFNAIEGHRGKNSLALKEGSVTSRVSRGNGQTDAAGKVRLAGLALDGKAGEAGFSYRVAGGTAFIDNAAFRLDGTTVDIARLTVRMPEKQPGPARYPLSLGISGCDIHRDKVEAKGLSGTLRGIYGSDGGRAWLEGSADLASGDIFWQGRGVASATAHLVFSRSGAKVDLAGRLFGGSLRGEAVGSRGGGSFRLAVTDVAVAKAGALIPRKVAVTPTSGTVDAVWGGGYTHDDGLTSRFEVRGHGISLADGRSKTLVTGARISLVGDTAGQKVSVRDAVIGAGTGLTLTVQGEVDHVFSSQRTGNFAFVLPKASLGDLIDPFINALPRFVQEATLDGALGGEGNLGLHDGRMLLEGALQFTGAGMAVPSQRFSVAGVNGRLPFSLDLSGRTASGSHETVSFARKDYARLLEQLRKEPAGGQSLSVGKIAFGPLELGTLTMRFSAGNGITELLSLKSSLYEADMLGRGFVMLQKGITYKGEMLVNGLSLKQLCTVFPKTRGYISGRLDGAVTVYGTAAALAGLSGFADLWAREDSREKMLVSKEFLQQLAGKKLKSYFFRSDRPYDQAEITAVLEKGYLTFETLDILHTNLFGIRDLSVTIVPDQNRIALDHLFNAISQAAVRGKAATGGAVPTEAPAEPEFKWQE